MHIGDQFFDENNFRFLTVKGFCIDPSVFYCDIAEYNSEVDDFFFTDTGLFTEFELKYMEKSYNEE